MNSREKPKAIDRTEMMDVRRAVTRGWDVPPEKLHNVAVRCQALLDDPEAYPRDKEQAEKTIALIEGAR